MKKIKFWESLELLKKHLVWGILISIILGLIIGYFFEINYLKSLIFPLTILMIYPIMVTLNTKSLISRCNLKLQTSILLFNFILIPIIGFLIGKLFFPNDAILTFAIFIIAILPTSAMTISWTGFAKGDVEIAVKSTILGLFLGAILMPIYLKLFMGKIIDLNLTQITYQILKIIFIPLILGLITQIILKKIYGISKFKEEIKPKFPLISTLSVLGVIFIAIALKAKNIFENPYIVIQILFPIFIFYLLNYFLTFMFGKLFLNKKESITLIYSSVMRNLSIALGLALIVFKENGSLIALVISIAYIFQVKSAALFVKFFNKT